MRFRSVVSEKILKGLLYIYMYTLILVLFIPLCRSNNLSGIIFLLSKQLP